jgi:predicted ester cyclase
VDILDEIIAPSYVNHNPGTPGRPPGPQGLKPIALAIRQAFPDLNYTIENIAATENQVAAHTIMNGTHDGDFFGIAATGKTIKIAQTQIKS